MPNFSFFWQNFNSIRELGKDVPNQRHEGLFEVLAPPNDVKMVVLPIGQGKLYSTKQTIIRVEAAPISIPNY